jgi:hypothetical protein
VVTDPDELVKAVRAVNQAGKPARANNVILALRSTAGRVGYLDVTTVAEDLAELESRGKLEQVPAPAWGEIGQPKTLIAYVVAVDPSD